MENSQNLCGVGMSRHFISKRDLKKIRPRVESLHIDFTDITRLEVESRGRMTIYYFEKRPFFFEAERLIPTLFLLNAVNPNGKRVTVDDGAVPHIIKGSDIFIRGITEVDPDIVPGDMVYVRNQKGTFIAVGVASEPSEKLLSNSTGMGIRTLHYLNDRIMRESV